jgi:hypothetical protein
LAVALAVRAKMCEIPVDESVAKGGPIREDGRLVPRHVIRAGQVGARMDRALGSLQILATISGDKAFGHLDEGGHPLVKRL